MTTCTWDGVRLSADTRSITGDVIDQSPCQKIFQRKGVFCAVAGDLAEATQVVKHLLNPRRVDPPDDMEGDWQIILIGQNRQEYYAGSLSPAPMAAPYAIGSGGSYALAAMLCGKPGPQAIRVAAKMDANTGVEFGIRTYRPKTTPPAGR